MARRKPGGYVVIVGRKPGVYTDWIDVKSQTDGVPKNSHQSYPTLQEAKEAFKAKLDEGEVRAYHDGDSPGEDSGVGDSLDDVPVIPSAATRARASRSGSAATGTHTSSASTREASARARAARPAEPQRPPTPPTEDDERDARRRERGRENGARRQSGGGRSRHEDRDERSPAPPPKHREHGDRVKTEQASTKENVRVKTESASAKPRDAPRRAPEPGTPRRSPKRQTRSPVVIETDSDSDAPPLPRVRSPQRRAKHPIPDPELDDSDEESVRYVSFSPRPTPGWGESVSTGPKFARPDTPEADTRQNSQSTHYHTAGSVPPSPATDASGSRRRPDAGGAASTSSSPPTGVTQYEDPTGKSAFHEHRRAEEAEKRRQRETTVDSESSTHRSNAGGRQDTEPEGDSDIEYVDSPNAPLPRFDPATHTTRPTRRAHTEPILYPTRPNSPMMPPTPVRIAKSRSMPASSISSSGPSLAYTVCRACTQPMPNRPLVRSKLSERRCERCFQPLPSKAAASPRISRQHTADETSSKRRSQPIPSPSEAGDSDGDEVLSEVHEVEPAESGIGLGLTMGMSTSSFMRPSSVFNPSYDPRSPMRGTQSLPVNGSAISFERPPQFYHRPSPAASASGR